MKSFFSSFVNNPLLTQRTIVSAVRIFPNLFTAEVGSV